ncbi:hypothetical protein AMTR_s00057p00056820 [Amborella trichopoda]|uniref:Uncharacterized protein n=1 Tax=Amborella trichopoda TaxID=13333 RepID=U5D5Q5_AMBTC|nr:hypothetical protein AMTR_s00057p00056820 [Amborella trichopoda]
MLKPKVQDCLAKFKASDLLKFGLKESILIDNGIPNLGLKSFIAIGRSNPSPLNGTDSTPTKFATTFHMLFQVNTSPLEQLKAWFLAFIVVAAHICYSANKSASLASKKCSHEYLHPGNLKAIPSCLHISA